jgi:hypothetical protein
MINKIRCLGMREVSKEQISLFNSAYVTEVSLSERVKLDRLLLDDDRAVARFSVESAYKDKNGVYHLTVPVVTNVLFQVGLVSTAVLSGLNDARKKEAFMRELNMKCSKPVNKQSDINFQLKLKRHGSSSHGQYMFGEFDVENGSFFGTSSFVFGG